MNSSRNYLSPEVIFFYKNNHILVNAYWLLGFVEAEGTFGFKNLSPKLF